MSIKKYTIEFLGTLALTLIILSTLHYVYDFLAIGIGLSIIIFIASKHEDPNYLPALNPAIVLVFYFIRSISWTEILPFIVAEVLGAGFATLLFFHFTKKKYIL